MKILLNNTYSWFLFTLMLTGCSKTPDTLFVLRSPEETGVNFTNRIVETDSFNILTEEYIFNGGGVAVADFNNDGKPDLFFAGNQVENEMYLNLGSFRFKNISREAGIGAPSKWSTGVAVVDINGDGWKDIYVCAAIHPGRAERKNMLFINQGLNEAGIPYFLDQAAEYGVTSPENSMHAAFFDYNRDGHLDLYVLNNEQSGILPTNYRERIMDGSARSNDRLYRNNGNGTFTDVTREAGILIEGFGLGLGFADFNQDTWTDIYVSNDYLTNDVLYLNNTTGGFENEIDRLVRHQSKFSMGSDIADFNNDGFLDIVTLDMLGDSNYRMKTTISENNYIHYVLNERWGYEYQYMRNMLQMGNGPGLPFSEIGLMAGIYKTDWSWSPLFVDVDQDGNRDLLITNGFPRDITDRDFSDFRLHAGPYVSPGDILDSIPVVKLPNYAFKNQGNWTFADRGEDWGLNLPSFSNGAIYADLDGDGDMDYVVSNINEPAFVFENTYAGPDRHLLVDLKGPPGNTQGIGAKVVVREPNGAFQYHEHYVNRGYMSAIDQPVHFGLGDWQDSLRLEILWPDGRFQVYEDNLTAGRVTLDYADAQPTRTEAPDFPLSPPPADYQLRDVSGAGGLAYRHAETDIVDYNLQRTLPHKLSQFGPCMASGDLDGNGTIDFIVGSASGHSPVLFMQDTDAGFHQRRMFDKDADKAFEEQGIALFDLENDGDLDIYLVSGSNEFEDSESLHRDRLYINDGFGNFQHEPGRMPNISSNGSVVRPMDFDGDGYTDLFVGGRSPMGAYPEPDSSHILRNVRGRLKDVTDALAPGLRTPGMVNDATWTDVNLDGRPDLVIVGEFMAVSIFGNTPDGLIRLDSTGLDSYTGWWRSVLAGDFDSDGDPDLILGNLGANNYYDPSEEAPVTLLAKDFDQNGSIDPLLFAYFKNEAGQKESFPVHFWGDLLKQSPIFRAKFNRYREYARASQSQLLSDEEREGAIRLTGVYDKSVYAENLRDGTFQLHELPKEAQIAPLNDIQVLDFNKDGIDDLLLVGNDYGNETFIGRYDAFNGLVLIGDGKGGFQPVPARNSGFKVLGDAKSIDKIRLNDGSDLILIAQNRDSLRVFKMN